MTFKKIFIYFSLIPVIIAILNKEITSINFLPWAHDNVNEIGLVLLGIAGLNCLYIIFRNFQTGLNDKFWHVFTGLMAILFFGYLYIGLSLSNAGF